MPRHFNETFDERYESNEALQHFGVKGMKWGRRTGGADGGGGSSGGGGGSARSDRKAARAEKSLAKATTKLAKKTEAIDAANKRDDSIVKAREDVGKTQNAVKLAKSQYKVDKHVIGKKAAKEVLSEAKTTHFNTISLAAQKTGREQFEANREFYSKLVIGTMKAIV